MNQCRALTIETRRRVTGWYCQVEDKHYIIPDDAFIEEDDYGLCCGIEGSVRVDPETVGQQTGLKGENNKEIYEGDIVKRITTGTQPIMVVKWGQIGWNPFENNLVDLSNIASYKVIGNIHKNPELLENKNE